MAKAVKIVRKPIKLDDGEIHGDEVVLVLDDGTEVSNIGSVQIASRSPVRLGSPLDTADLLTDVTFVGPMEYVDQIAQPTDDQREAVLRYRQRQLERDK